MLQSFIDYPEPFPMRPFNPLSRSAVLSVAVAACTFTPASVLASDDGLEVWLNPAISTDLDDDTSIELETAQRFRNSADGRADTYFFRLWVNQSLSDEFTLSGAVEQRINDGGSDELRTIQQLSGKHGIIRTRLRLEQRFVENADRTGLRLRPRVGVKVPLGEDSPWSAKADVEAILTLASTRRGGDDGLTGMRTQLGIDYEVNDNLTLGLTYLRQQEFRDSRPDEIGHAPLIGIEFSF